MEKYNFDETIDRRGTSCNKWEYNVPEDVIPMQVADMDFAAAPEIHADFVYDGKHHTPMASVSEYAMDYTITAYAPSKTFNVAGLCQSYVVIPNKKLFNAYDATCNVFDLVFILEFAKGGTEPCMEAVFAKCEKKEDSRSKRWLMLPDTQSVISHRLKEI